MYNRFTYFVEKNQLFGPTPNILLAVSGGVDSMVLLDLFNKSDVNFSVVHCNFKLRGSESDADEAFVKDEVEKLGVKLFSRCFDTEDYAKVNGISIEMAARDLRYSYFNELREEYKYTSIATAHHRDDIIETFFINLIRKTGIKGLTGIKSKTDYIIRPLLFAGREDILSYAAIGNIKYRHDSSNDSVEFKRNYIRHKILPLFENINPAYRNNILSGINHLKEVEEVYLNTLEKETDKIVSVNKNNTNIKIAGLLKASFPKVLLFEILNDFHFNNSVITEVYESLLEESGKQFFSPTHRIIKDREELIITEITDVLSTVVYIEEEDIELFNPLKLVMQIIKSEKYKIPRELNVASLDYDKLSFPLVIKKWKKGEYFQPLGMNGFKKVSDFFIDEKLSIPEKENAWILYSEDKIVWVMGYRIDNRFKVTPDTKTIYSVTIQ